MLSLRWVGCGLFFVLVWTGLSAERAAIFYEEGMGYDRSWAGELAGHAVAAGYEVEWIGLAQFTNRAALTNIGRTLILPQARRLPAPAVTTVDAFLKAGGRVLAVGVPAWKPGLFQVGGQWLGRGEYEAILNRQRPVRVLMDFSSGDMSGWRRASNTPERPMHWAIESDGGNAVLHVRIEDFTGWDILSSPNLTQPFPPGHTLTCFRARGAPATRQLAVEWVEADGSRWIATVQVSTQWQHYVLPPEAFRAWQPPPARAGPQARFNPAQAVRFTIGIAQSHTAVSGRVHEYWLDEVGTAPNPFGDVPAPGFVNHPHLEGLCPDYLFYPVETPVRVQTPGDLGLAGPLRLGRALPAGVYALHPRQQGEGFDQRRPWRWQPLLEARDERTGDYRGALGAWMGFFEGPYAGSLRVVFTPEPPAFYREKEVREWLPEVLAAMRRGVFFKDGGAELFTVFTNQATRLGVTVANWGSASEAQVGLRAETLQGRREWFAHEWKLRLEPPGVMTLSAVQPPKFWPREGCRITVEIRVGGRVVDRLQHELHVWEPPARPEYVTARGGRLMWRGQPWKAHGVNYMPATGIALPHDYFEHWVGRGGYDPEVVQRDLERIRAMGLNSVSAFIYYRSLDGGHLLDFLRRCERLGLKVNQSLRPGTPMDFRWHEMKALIEHFRLAQQDNIMAYDLAWEPSHYDHAYQRRHYAQGWRQWVQRRYGDVGRAEAVWGFMAPRAEGALDVPEAGHLFKDGPWRKMVADYRLFLDELVGQRYGEARRLVKSIDPHHLVSFRMQMSGDPTHNWPGLMPYDFYGLRQAVDIWEPEAYGRIGDWEKVRPGHFTAAYARLCNAGLPVVWAEMGNSVWDMNRMAPSPEKLSFTAQYYRDFYRMLRESGADGVFFWWYAGGFRLYENSDYGIINPDGTDREITGVIREEGARFMRAAKPASPDYWIEVDRDRDARGLHGIYEAVKEEYWQAVAAGRIPALRWAREPGQR
ncbi:hypothetical protein NXS98_03550 [Fontisphaera persica]|uniref:hypothetical protein n=1 Tax=Fontisphaera persica TaxID=2974023 RepID=UPI0024BFC803|nr:hypothetical protein [Fontisphaera persica]WCJ60216.1 hypothetical protein NXS98_03550 [Fontisphaera persica]